MSIVVGRNMENCN